MRRRLFKSPASINNSIPAIYQLSFIDISLWSWVTSASKHGINKTEAVMNYRDHFGLDEDSAPLSNLLTKYWRINDLYIKSTQTLGRVIVRVPEADASGLSQLGPILEALTEIVKENRKSK